MLYFQKIIESEAHSTAGDHDENCGTKTRIFVYILSAAQPPTQIKQHQDQASCQKCGKMLHHAHNGGGVLPVRHGALFLHPQLVHHYHIFLEGITAIN